MRLENKVGGGLLLAAELHCVCQKLSRSNNVTFTAVMMVCDEYSQST